MKLNLDALKSKAKEVATQKLMETINGGTKDDCHFGPIVVDPDKRLA